MKVTLELVPIDDTTTKIGIKYIVKNVKFDNVYIETIMDVKLTEKEDTNYATAANAISEYFDKLNFALNPVI